MIEIIKATPSSSSSSALALSQHVISADFTIPASQAAYVTRYVEIAAGITLTIEADGDLEIG